MKHDLIKKLFALCVVAVMAVVAGCGEQSIEKKYLNIATGGTAGTYYPIGGAIAEILNKSIPGMNASAQSTGASVSNINMLYSGDVDLAIVQNDITYYAAHGTEMFADKDVKNIRGIATLYPETCQFVTLDKSGINSVADLRGKRVAVGASGSGAEANARQILEAYGLTYSDIEPQYLSFAEGANALKDGNVDAALFELPAEKELLEAAAHVPPCTALTSKQYLQALTDLQTLKEPLEKFFTDVMVNVPDEKLRNNRLALLSVVREKLNQTGADITAL